MIDPTSDSTDYSDFKDTTKPSVEAFAALNALVGEARDTQAEIFRLARLLKEQTERLNGILYIRLPTMADEMGLQKFTTSDGLDVQIKEEIEAHVNKANQPTAFKWLEDNNHGGLIKREIKVSFNREQAEAAKLLMAELSGKYAGVNEKQSVHHGTLKSWVKEMLGKGAALPEVFGVRRIKVAKIPDLKPIKAKAEDEDED
jgi:hypothetical protein